MVSQPKGLFNEKDKNKHSSRSRRRENRKRGNEKRGNEKRKSDKRNEKRGEEGGDKYTGLLSFLNEDKK
jgi:hypothetical protein